MKCQNSLSQYLDTLQQGGRYWFDKKSTLKKLRLSEEAFKAACQRLAKKNRVVFLRKGFYVIVPLEYRVSKIIPPSWFINNLMSYLSRPYYVGLLSAAACYGASPQQPQWFQVITNSVERPIDAAGLCISFYKKKLMSKTPVKKIKTQTGFMNVSTPAATALDLAQYADQIGGLSYVKEVLTELVEAMTPEDLLKSSQNNVKLPYVQRLGFLLDLLGEDQLAKPLAAWLATQPTRLIFLNPNGDKIKVSKNSIWRLWNNELELST